MSVINVVDTSSLFDLKKFPEDVFPSLWERLDTLIGEGRFIAPREVLREVEAGDDEITRWAKAHRTMFVELDEPTGQCIEELLEAFEGLRDTVRQGPRLADPVVVALCLARSRADTRNEYVVVTQENKKGPGSLQIPNLCEPFDLTSIKVMELFRREGFRF